MTLEQQKFLSLLTGRALRITAAEQLAVAFYLEKHRFEESEWHFKRACWLEHEARVVEAMRIDYKVYWQRVQSYR